LDANFRLDTDKTDKLFLRLWLLIRLLIKMQDCGRRHVDFTGNSNVRQAWSEMMSFIRKQNVVVHVTNCS